MALVKALVLCGDGINCERDTARALKLAGATPEIQSVYELLENPAQLHQYQIPALPGGFSFGDEIRSGKILALKLKYGLQDHLYDFKGLTIGICNGFQALIQLGLFEDPSLPRTMTLAQNKQGTFLDRWVELQIVNRRGPWMEFLPNTFSLPIRHGEGRLVVKDHQIFSPLQALKYSEDINGSFDQTAALVSLDGKILGLMPHPEAAIKSELCPDFIESIGSQFFESAVKSCQ